MYPETLPTDCRQQKSAFFSSPDWALHRAVQCVGSCSSHIWHEAIYHGHYQYTCSAISSRHSFSLLCDQSAAKLDVLLISIILTLQTNAPKQNHISPIHLFVFYILFFCNCPQAQQWNQKVSNTGSNGISIFIALLAVKLVHLGSDSGDKFIHAAVLYLMVLEFQTYCHQHQPIEANVVHI